MSLCCLSKFIAAMVDEHTGITNTHKRGALRNLKDFIGFWGLNQNIIKKISIPSSDARVQHSILKRPSGT